MYDLRCMHQADIGKIYFNIFYQGTVIRDRIQEGIRKQQLKRLLYDEDDDDELYGDDFEEENYDEDEN